MAPCLAGDILNATPKYCQLSSVRLPPSPPFLPLEVSLPYPYNVHSEEREGLPPSYILPSHSPALSPSPGMTDGYWLTKFYLAGGPGNLANKDAVPAEFRRQR